MKLYKHQGNYIVGAYATSPNLFTWDEASEYTYFNLLKQIPTIRGLELPFWGQSLHPFDVDWLLANIEPKWENVLTCVPGTMKYLENDPYFGLASINEDSRKSAISFYKRAFDSINLLKSYYGNNSVIAMHLTSSPRVNATDAHANTEKLIESMRILSDWDWGETKLMIEHCDAYSEKNTNPKKGFLSLDEELNAIEKVHVQWGTRYSIVLNWARSVIERKSVSGPLEHIKASVEANLLGSLMFSGTTDKHENLYGAWSDIHMPTARYRNSIYYEQESLMSYENIKKTLDECANHNLEYIGIKLLTLPEDTDIISRIGVNREAMFILDDVIGGI